MGEATILGVLRENGYGIRPMAAATPDLAAAGLAPVKPFQWVGRQNLSQSRESFLLSTPESRSRVAREKRDRVNRPF